jgi:hypothetical protein
MMNTPMIAMLTSIVAPIALSLALAVTISSQVVVIALSTLLIENPFRSGIFS